MVFQRKPSFFLDLSGDQAAPSSTKPVQVAVEQKKPAAAAAATPAAESAPAESVLAESAPAKADASAAAAAGEAAKPVLTTAGLGARHPADHIEIGMLEIHTGVDHRHIDIDPLAGSVETDLRVVVGEDAFDAGRHLLGADRHFSIGLDVRHPRCPGQRRGGLAGHARAARRLCQRLELCERGQAATVERRLQHERHRRRSQRGAQKERAHPEFPRLQYARFGTGVATDSPAYLWSVCCAPVKTTGHCA